MKLTEKVFKKQCVYKGKAVDMYNDIVILPNNEKATREYLGHPGAVAVVPFINKTYIVFVRQFRYPVNQITYEIPAGKLDKNELPLKCVNRELQEETGYKSKKIEKLLSFWPTPAFSNEILHIYKATNLTKGNINPDEDEFIDTVVISYSKALEMIKNGKIKDSKTIIALTYLSIL
jgi:ADP-ribose pyrophosphatase